jgi:hypothetical protein
MFHSRLEDLDRKYSWNDTDLLGRTLSQPDSVINSNRKVHRPDNTAPCLHGK